MKLRIEREANGYLGFYYCHAVKEIALNLTTHFGIRLRFQQPEKAKDEFAETMVAVYNEQARLSKLTNEALVAEATRTQAGDFDVVLVMCDRLDPNWLSRDDGFTTSPWAASDEALND